ncbi:MAG: type I glutamate--ammonia ligase [Roseiflexus sp.]|jgi:glutamine synthetase|nr:type I glutamate--ammonia ligase [Roseiflexus sp.]MBO9334763.1 type I glutamate--ammonia ligase [Roseiflexus sp.]MBO9363663.1 type I glutamate--ammonia ligase [Roseiflexus sp.]MBO9383799.1 type I glutamate--ammonia ligase [Roseiflexus sp.]MBO9388199.1 type I glutamate--ammonia ligase [Roseiflexus sp.]
MGMTPKDVLAMIKEHDIKMVDVRFTDLPGTWQHFSLPASMLSEDDFVNGLGFDGSSIRGFQAINESDMLVVPDPDTAFIDPLLKIPTLVLICDIRDPITGENYSRDPRYIAKKAEDYLRSTGIADTAYFGPEAEFFLFSDVRFDQGSHFGYYFLDSDEGIWNSGADRGGKNLGYRPRYKEGYFPCPPLDTLQDVRSQITLNMIAAGIEVEVHHHEVATAGQCEIDMRFDSLLRMADKLVKYKYIVKNTARQFGLTATFMPKPLFGDNGSGMHCHQSLWKEGQPLFYDPKGYALLSDTARWYIGGILAHAPALLAICAPTTNSYRRLVPGFEAPINLVYSQRNRSAAIRIPTYSDSPKARRIEFRAPDPTCNPYLAFSAMLMAGIDGIKNRIEPPPPLDVDIYELTAEEKAHIRGTPGSLAESLDALEADHDFLLAGGVFTPDVIETYLDYKRSRELIQVAIRPHPYEFFMYFDA